MQAKDESFWKRLVAILKESWKRISFYAFLAVAVGAIAVSSLTHLLPLEKAWYLVAAGCLAMLVVIFELLLGLESGANHAPSTFPNLAVAYPHIHETMEEAQRLSGKGQITHVDIITSTATSGLSQLKNDVKDLKNAQFRITILHPDRSPARAVAEAWPDEIRASTTAIEQLKSQEDLKERHVSFYYRTYHSLPSLQGTLIDDRFLYLGHYYWREDADPHAAKLEGAEKPYHYL